MFRTIHTPNWIKTQHFSLCFDINEISFVETNKSLVLHLILTFWCDLDKGIVDSLNYDYANVGKLI